jgi:hypothetical protein
MLGTVLSGHWAESVVVHGFQGLLRHSDGKRCDPFTITDAHSRFLDSLPDRLAYRPEPGPSNLRGGDAGVRRAGTDRNRQRRTLCGHRVNSQLSSNATQAAGVQVPEGCSSPKGEQQRRHQLAQKLGYLLAKYFALKSWLLSWSHQISTRSSFETWRSEN